MLHHSLFVPVTTVNPKKLTNSSNTRFFFSLHLIVMKKWVFILFTLTFCGSCHRRNTVSSTNSNIFVRLQEEFKGSTTNLKLFLFTEEKFGCSNYSLLSSGRVIGNTISLTVSGISKGEICLTSIGPATAEINLGALENKTYLIEITHQGKMYSGSLKVSEDAYLLTFNKTKPFIGDNPMLKRIPPSTIWGYVGYHKASTANTVKGFVDSVIYLGGQYRSYPEGNYYEFYVDGSGQPIIPANTGYYFYRPVLMHYSGDLIQLQKLIRRYGLTYRDSLNIGIYTRTGEFYYSW